MKTRSERGTRILPLQSRENPLALDFPWLFESEGKFLCLSVENGLYNKQNDRFEIHYQGGSPSNLNKVELLTPGPSLLASLAQV